MEETTGDVPLPSGELTVGVIFNSKGENQGKTEDAQAEYDSLDTVYAIRAALQRAGCAVELFEADATLPGELVRRPIDLAFNIAEGLRGRGREAEVPALLNLLNIPFTGSDETALAIALDKELCKRLARSEGVPTPESVVAADQAGLARAEALRFPLIVKPNAEGSSKGIGELCLARDSRELERVVCRALADYGEPMLCEEYIEGREFTVGLLGNGAETRVFPPMEIIFRTDTHVYSYGVKQDYQRYVDYACPAHLSPEAERTMRDYARRVFTLLGCRDFGRVDFRMDGAGNIFFIEINPLPGLAPGYSDYPMLAAFSGVAYDGLVACVLRAALRRLGMEAER
jgi:D-alanine-D-alanine ligase